LANGRKFALLNLPRMKFHNPRLDIKVFRRPWMGRQVQKTYPCAATILKGLITSRWLGR
jgi:hypothetical protein